jgi:hypothetical protein
MKKKILFILSVFGLLAIAFFLPSYYKSFSSLKNGLEVRDFTSATSSNVYHFFMLGKNKMEFTLTRPDKKDKKTLLSIAGAFTLESKPDGVYGLSGVIFNRDSVNHRLGGAIKIFGDSIEIFSTNKGAIFTKGYLDTLEKLKASFFQQIQMIVHSNPEDSKSPKQFQCRGIAILATGEVAVVESEKAITLKTFAADLAENKLVRELLYTDMGAWDEGWYRDKTGDVKVIGNERSQTMKQSNWIVFRSRQ